MYTVSIIVNIFYSCIHGWCMLDYLILKTIENFEFILGIQNNENIED